jgi:hypothetical protein
VNSLVKFFAFFPEPEISLLTNLVRLTDLPHPGLDLPPGGGALAARVEGAFVQHILASLPVFPPQYVDIKRVNAGLLRPSEEKANELELGRNVCALTGAYVEPT